MIRAAEGGTRLRLYMLITLFSVLQLADVLTSNHLLRTPGYGEGNPIEAATMTHLGALWWLPKLALVAFAFLTAPRVRVTWPYYFVVAFYAAVVANNLAIM